MPGDAVCALVRREGIHSRGVHVGRIEGGVVAVVRGRFVAARDRGAVGHRRHGRGGHRHGERDRIRVRGTGGNHARARAGNGLADRRASPAAARCGHEREAGGQRVGDGDRARRGRRAERVVRGDRVHAVGAHRERTGVCERDAKVRRDHARVRRRRVVAGTRVARVGRVGDAGGRDDLRRVRDRPRLRRRAVDRDRYRAARGQRRDGARDVVAHDAHRAAHRAARRTRYTRP